MFKIKFDKLIKNNIKVNILGDIGIFNMDLQNKIKILEKKSLNNTGLNLNIA